MFPNCSPKWMHPLRQEERSQYLKLKDLNFTNPRDVKWNEWVHFSFLFSLSLFFFGHTLSMWKFLGWGSNPSYSSPLPSCGNAGSLTCSTIQELPSGCTFHQVAVVPQQSCPPRHSVTDLRHSLLQQSKNCPGHCWASISI